MFILSRSIFQIGTISILFFSSCSSWSYVIIIFLLTFSCFSIFSRLLISLLRVSGAVISQDTCMAVVGLFSRRNTKSTSWFLLSFQYLMSILGSCSIFLFNSM